METTILTIASDSVSSLRETCTAEILKCPEDQFLQRACRMCDMCGELSSPTADSDKLLIRGRDTIASWVQKYTQAVLDLTHVQENQLVERDFKGPQDKNKLLEIIGLLESPKAHVKEAFGSDMQPQEILGIEIAECLLWRKGALAYMYCSVLQEHPERVKADRDFFLQTAELGVGSLQLMFQVRTPLAEQRQQVLTNDESTYELLQTGLYSDTHVLGLMYGGELCYWYLEYSMNSAEGVPEMVQPMLDAANLGTQFLQVYMDAVKGPLKGKGWTCDRAEKILSVIQTRYTMCKQNLQSKP